MEAEYTSMRIREIEVTPIEGCFDFNHFCEVHRYIFQDMYAWAGQPRTIDIEKVELALGGLSIEYSHVQEIEESIVQILNDLHIIKWEELPIDEKAVRFSKCMAEL